MQDGENGNGATFKDKFKSFGKDVKDRFQEGATVVPLNQLGGWTGDVASQVKHGVEEEITGLSGTIDVIGDRFGQAGEYIGETSKNLVNSAKKDLSPRVVGGELRNFALDIVGRIQRGAQEVVGRNWGKVATLYNDHVSPVLKKNDIDSSLKQFNAYDSFSERNQPTPEVMADVEGDQIITDVMGNLKAAVDFDQAKDQALSAMVEKALGGTELARKIGPDLLNGLIAVMLESANFSGRTFNAQKGLQALLSNPEQLAELKKNQVDLVDLVADLNAALTDISSKRELVMQSRGEDKNLSWEYEGDLIAASEGAQVLAKHLGREMTALLPESASQLSIDRLIAVRAKSHELADALRDVTNPLISVGKSMEKRFPDKVQEVRAAVTKALDKWMESKGIARQLMTEVQVDEKVRLQASQDVIKGIVEKDAFFNELTSEQQTTVLDKVGAKVSGEGDSVKYDREAGKIYDQAAAASEEYTRLVICYEQSRDYVQQHPEAADMLMVLAENVMQAKSRMELAQNKLEAEILVQSHKVKNQSDFDALRQGNLSKEDAARVQRKENYAWILARYNERVQREAPTIKKIAALLGAAGFSVVIGKEMGPEVVEATIEAAKFIAKVLIDNAPMIIDNAVLGAKAVGVGGALAAPVLLWNWAREKIGGLAEKSAEKQLDQNEKDKAAATKKLEETYGQLIKLGKQEEADQIKQIMDSLNK